MEGRVGASRLWIMLALVLAGEAVFMLPFNLARFFRPTLLELTGMSNAELGAAQGIYGVVAFAAYLCGGPIADRVPAHKLMAWSLWTTALGGIYLGTFPGTLGASILWAAFGLSTILLFWAALIRATRAWAPAREQGRAFGLLDAGRGAVAALLASGGVAALAWAFPEGAELATRSEKEAVMRQIIAGYSLVTVGCGFLVWTVLPDPKQGALSRESLGLRAALEDLRSTAGRPQIWWQALIVLCAYVGYKGFDNYTLYAVEAHGLDPVEAAKLATLGAWMRPIAALGAGLLADRFGGARMTVAAFVLLLLSDLYFALSSPEGLGVLGGALLLNTLLACAAIFALRGLYFALFEEAGVGMATTGSAVGLVSLVGYTPDIFVTYVAGRMNEASPGLEGHQNFFFFLAAFSGLGLLAALAFGRSAAARRTTTEA